MSDPLHKRVPCTGPTCMGTQLPPVLKAGTKLRWNDVYHLDLHRDDPNKNFVLKDGWKYVKKVGYCCPRCINFMLAEWGKMYG